MDNYYVNRILQEKKITAFLQERNIYPIRKSGDKWIYRCPLHAGDNDPSFVVYPVGTKGRNYQTYHCFGCRSGINLINLKSELDKISTKEAIAFFLRDININSDEVLDSVISDIQKEKEFIEEDGRIEMLLLSINTICKEYLERYGDEEEVVFFDSKFFKKVDKIARARDIETLEAYYNMLMENNILIQRAEDISKRKEEEEISATKWRI